GGGRVAEVDVLGNSGADLANRRRDVVFVWGRQDVKTADNGKHLVDARGRHRGADRVDDAPMAARSEHDKPTSFHVIHSGDLVIKIVWNVNARIFFRRHLVGEATEAVKDADYLRGRTQGFLERNLPDAAGSKCMIDDDRRL